MNGPDRLIPAFTALEHIQGRRQALQLLEPHEPGRQRRLGLGMERHGPAFPLLLHMAPVDCDPVVVLQQLIGA